MSFKLVVHHNPETHTVEIIDIEEDKIPSDLIIWSWDHFNQCPIYAPADTPLPAYKFDKHANHKGKVRFECELAYTVLKNSAFFLPILHRIGAKIISQIQSHEKDLNEIDKSIFRQHIGRAFRHTLYPEKKAHFGRIGELKDTPSSQDMYKIGMKILNSEKRIERILTVFLVVQSIYKLLTPSDTVTAALTEMKAFEDICRHSDLFKNRGREESSDTAALSKRFGIGDDTLQLPYSIELHTRSVERSSRDHINPSAFAIEAYQKEIPFICGPSFHTAKLLATIIPLCKDFSQDAKQQYALCCAAFLIAAGAHSFHEVFKVATLFNLPYQTGNYTSALPESFRLSNLYYNLGLQFSDIIKPLSEEEIARITFHVSMSSPQPTSPLFVSSSAGALSPFLVRSHSPSSSETAPHRSPKNFRSPSKFAASPAHTNSASTLEIPTSFSNSPIKQTFNPQRSPDSSKSNQPFRLFSPTPTRFCTPSFSPQRVRMFNQVESSPTSSSNNDTCRPAPILIKRLKFGGDDNA